jgi:hypothetical protein
MFSKKKETTKTDIEDDLQRERKRIEDNLQRKRKRIEALQREREHIERLFADRINFYLVFAAGILIFVFDRPHDPELLKAALFVVVIVSSLMLVALLRTFVLVKDVLNDIKEEYPEEPYSQYSKRMRWLLPNANDLLLGLPVAMTLFFVYALIQVWKHFPALPDN